MRWSSAIWQGVIGASHRVKRRPNIALCLPQRAVDLGVRLEASRFAFVGEAVAHAAVVDRHRQYELGLPAGARLNERRGVLVERLERADEEGGIVRPIVAHLVLRRALSELE